MNPISQRLLNQQLICPQFTTPHDVVAWMGAMQAQEYKMMRWAVGMRTRRPSAKAFEKAYNSGRIVRAHLFRTTWQLVAGEDLGWMLNLCRDNALRGMAGWMHSNGVDIPRDEQDSIQTIMADYLVAHRTAMKADFAAALAAQGIAMEDHRLSYHIRLAEYAGLLCSGDLHPQKPTYALVADKLPPQAPLSRDEALARLARTYFRSHGPATLEDFVWWSGLNTGDCRKALNAIRAELIEDRWKGLQLFRHLAVQPDHMHRAHSGNGIFWPVILQDGQAIGNWTLAAGKVQTTPFHPDTPIALDPLQEQIERYTSFQA